MRPTRTTNELLGNIFIILKLVLPVQSVITFVKKLSIPKSNHFFSINNIIEFELFSKFIFFLQKKNKIKEKYCRVECDLNVYAQDELGAFANLAACTIQTKPTRRESVCSLLISLFRRRAFEKRNLLTAPKFNTAR